MSQHLHADILQLLPSLRAFARSLTRDATDADDLLQETLLKALGRAHQFTPGTNLRAWLFTIARNTFYTNHNRKRREVASSLDEEQRGLGCAPEQHWNLKLKTVHGALQQLPPDQREALILVGGAGFSYEEAAEICGCALGTVKSRVSRGRTRLLELLSASSHHEFMRDDHFAV